MNYSTNSTNKLYLVTTLIFLSLTSSNLLGAQKSEHLKRIENSLGVCVELVSSGLKRMNAKLAASKEPNIVVTKYEDLDQAWAQRVMDLAGLGVVVQGFEVTGVDYGTTTRVRVTVRHNGGDEIPTKWFVKLATKSMVVGLVTFLSRLLATEVAFYRDMSKDYPDILQPVVIAAQSRFKDSIVVLGNLEADHGTPGLPIDTFSVEKAEEAIKLLATLHVKNWGDEGIKKRYNWSNDFWRHLEGVVGNLFAGWLMKRGLREANYKIPEELHEQALRYSKGRGQAMEHLEQGILTVVHHDTHPGNWFVRLGRIGLLDWQMARLGEGVGDIAYLLATAMNPVVRKANERYLLEVYRKALAAKGIEVNSEELYQRYRSHLAYAFEAMVMTLAIGNLMGGRLLMDLESNYQVIARAAAAVRDNKSFETFGYITETQ